MLLRGTKREEVERGQVLAKPGSINAAHEVRVRGVHPDEGRGGRHTPFFKGYRPQFYFRTTDVTGAVELPEATEMVMPGDNIKMKVELICPDRDGRGPYGSRSAKAAAPWAPASSPRSFNKESRETHGESEH